MVFVWALFSVLGIVLFPVPAFADGLEWSNSGIQGPKYSQILLWMERLAAQHPDLVELVDYGTSVQGRTLRMMVVKKATHSGRPVRGRPAVFMSGSTHGNEYLNIEDRLPERLLEVGRTERSEVATFLEEGGVLLFVPILNPDGYDARVRANAKGVDLNRDWDVPPAGFKGFKQPETRFLAKSLEQLRGSLGLEYRATIDYHCCIGAMLHPWSYTDDPLPEADLRRHQDIGQLADEQLQIEVGSTSEVLGYFATGTTKDYYYSKYGATAFTYEGRRRTEKDNLEKHVAWWRNLVAYFSPSLSTLMVTRLGRHRPQPFSLIAE